MLPFLRSIFQSIIVGIRMGFIEMWAHKLRSFLSSLGVLLGVASLVTMLTLISGIDVFLNEKIGKWAGMVHFYGKWNATQEERITWSRSPGMKYSDGVYMHKYDKNVRALKHIIERTVTTGIMGGATRIKLRGANQETYTDDLENAKIILGRGLHTKDFKTGAKTAVISNYLQIQYLTPRLRSLGLDSTAIIGKDITYRGNRYTIVGVFKQEGKGAHWLRRAALIPIRTVQKHITGFNPNPGFIQISVADPTIIQEQAEEISRTLQGLHRGAEDFQYYMADWVEKISTMFTNVSMLMTFIAVVSLLVGGLGIMNVMLSSISERIKEIGIRKALGANALQIFMQFIAETTTLSFMGGCIGALLGTAPLFFKEAIKKATDNVIEPTILPLHFVGILVIIISVGIVFGLYPALKASRMNPIDALHYE